MKKNTEILKLFSQQIDLLNTETEHSTGITNNMRQYLTHFNSAFKNFNQEILSITNSFSKKFEEDEKRYLETQIKISLKAFQRQAHDSLNLIECNSLHTDQFKILSKQITENRKNIILKLGKRQKDIEIFLKEVLGELKQYEDFDSKNTTLQLKIDKDRILASTFTTSKREKQIQKLEEKSKTSSFTLNNYKLKYSSNQVAINRQVELYCDEIINLFKEFVMEDKAVVQKLHNFAETLIKSHESSIERLKSLHNQLLKEDNFPEIMMKNFPIFSNSLRLNLPKLDSSRTGYNEAILGEIVRKWKQTLQQSKDKLRHLEKANTRTTENKELILKTKQKIDICSCVIEKFSTKQEPLAVDEMSIKFPSIKSSSSASKYTSSNSSGFVPIYSVPNFDKEHSDTNSVSTGIDGIYTELSLEEENSDTSSVSSGFNEIYTKLSLDEEQPDTNEKTPPFDTQTKWRVLHTYKANGESQLSITAGEIVDLVGEYDANKWCEVKNENDVIGYIPGNYIQALY